MQRTWLGLVGWLLLSFAASGIGGIASISAGSFYQQFDRPPWAPPSSWFGPVWTMLYLMMGIAAWLVWRRSGFARAKLALTTFIVQLAVNALWSWLFFAWRLGGLAFADIVVLWVLIICTIVLFWQHHRLAAALLLPYLGWVSFAAFLNFSIWQRNPQLLG